MKKLITILLTIFFLSCGKIPDLKPLVLCDLSIDFNRCRCRCYDLVKVKKVSPSECNVESPTKDWNTSIESCDGLSGFSVKDWSLYILPYLHRARENAKWVQDNEKNTLDQLSESFERKKKP